MLVFKGFRGGAGMDILSDAVRLLRLHASVFLHSTFCESWAVDISTFTTATFHVIASGKCWLHLPNREDAAPLKAGDLVICPRNAPHVVSNDAEFPPDSVPRNTPVSGDITTADHLEGPSTALICGYFEFSQQRWNPLLDALPEYVVIPTHNGSDSGLDSLINYMVYETRLANPGSDAVIDRLSDVLFIQAVRTYMEQQHQDSGYLAALTDPKLGKALGAFHTAVGEDWSVQKLAETAGMSRSAFADAFTDLVGMTPMQYVTGWRMQYAYDQLLTTSDSVAQIAENCGYMSESSFSKAFKKQFDMGPGAARHESDRLH
jgi:AraC-like DNA-binding protein